MLPVLAVLALLATRMHAFGREKRYWSIRYALDGLHTPLQSLKVAAHISCEAQLETLLSPLTMLTY